MVHLEVKNKPPALEDVELKHRNIQCLAFNYDENTKELAVYETYKEWCSNIPAYTICHVTNITYWDDNKEEEL